MDRREAPQVAAVAEVLCCQRPFAVNGCRSDDVTSPGRVLKSWKSPSYDPKVSFSGGGEWKIGKNWEKKWGNMLSWAPASLLEAPYFSYFSLAIDPSQEIRNLVVAMPGANGSDAAEYLRGWDKRCSTKDDLHRFCGTCHAQDHKILGFNMV